MKMKCSGFLPLFLTVFLFSELASAQVAKIQALYLFQFAKNIGWPEGDADKDFVVAVVGDPEVASELRNIAENKRVGNRKIEVRELNSTKTMEGVNILYVAGSKNSMLVSAAATASKNKTLLVSGEKGQCVNGASISFFKLDGNKLGFEISERNVKRSGLSVSPKLLNLGKSV